MEALEKPADLNENTRNSQSTGSNDSTETTGNPSSTNGFSESSSTSTVPQKQQNVKGKNLKSVIIGGEKYYIEDTPSAPSSNRGKKKTNEHAEEEPRAKYSRDAENQLDNQGKKTDNEIEFEGDTPVAQEVFDTYLTDGIKQSTRDIISKQIGENIKDFEALRDPVQMDRAFANLPFIKKLRTQYNLNIIQKNENYKNRYAVRYEYARRCFIHDSRIESITGQVYGNGKQKGMAHSVQEAGTKFNSGRDERGLQQNDSGKSVAARLGEYKGIKDQFDKLIDKHSKEKQSRDVSAFSFAGNPLSEEALKAKAEFETPLDKLEKVSRERLRKVERNIQDFGKRIGVPVHFVYHQDRGYRGVYIHNGGIYINLNSNVPARRIFMHEFVHWLKASGKDNNEIFTALDSVIETKQGTLNEVRMNEYRRTLYGGEEMSDSQIIANQSNYLYISTNINKKFIIQLKIIRKQVRFCIFITYLSLYSDNDSHGQNHPRLRGKDFFP